MSLPASPADRHQAVADEFARLMAATPDSSAPDPVAAWRHHAAAVQALITQHGEEDFTHPHIGTLPLDLAVDRFYVADVFMHSWDLARANGQDARRLMGFVGRDPGWAAA